MPGLFGKGVAGHAGAGMVPGTTAWFSNLGSTVLRVSEVGFAPPPPADLLAHKQTPYHTIQREN